MKILLLITVFSFGPFLDINPVQASSSPVLNFSDLSDGPRTGLGDGKGSGAIVTVWGNNLGTPTVSGGGIQTAGYSITVGGVAPAYVYYWKNADGTLPGGPSDLYTRQKMQEIAFSIGATTPTGSQLIQVTTPSGSSPGSGAGSVSFNVRTTGNFRFACPSSGGGCDGTHNGNDSNSGTWASPWATPKLDTTQLAAGDVVYVSGTRTFSGFTIGGSGGYGQSGSANNLTAIVSYPNSAITITPDAITNYGGNTTNFVVSKFAVAEAGDNCISGFANGRIVGNSCTTSACYNSDYNQSGALEGMGGCPQDGTGCWPTTLNGIKYLGNYIHDWQVGCNTTNKEHTTYLSIRSRETGVGCYEQAWNRYEGNDSRGALYFYDEGWAGAFASNCTNLVHHNWVQNQGGRCIGVVSNQFYSGPTPSGHWLIDDNVCLNAGLAGTGSYSQQETQVIISGGFTTDSWVHLYNNTFYGWGGGGCSADDCSAFQVYHSSGAGGPFTGVADFQNNIFYDTHNYYSSAYTYEGDSQDSAIIGNNNTWYSTASSNKPTLPTFDASDPTVSILDPQLNAPTSFDFTPAAGSRSLGSGANLLSAVPTDFYNNPRPSSMSRGAFDVSSGGGGDTTAPAAPSGLSVM